MTRQIYDMHILDNPVDVVDKYINTLILFNHRDARSFHSINQILKSGKVINNIIVFNYIQTDNKDDILLKLENLNDSNIIIKNIEIDERSLINELKNFENDFFENILYIDMSCISIPQLFVLIKFLKRKKENEPFKLLYTIPKSYYFVENPFTSYKTYEGDIDIKEIIGFSGDSTNVSNSKLVIFMGFEGSLSLKAVEETGYSDLILVNGSPSYHPKYKDLVVINNYNLITQNIGEIKYAPANNPFEVYNFLENIDNKSEGICIAPISTKPSSLGACLYALDNIDTRIIYPSAIKKINEFSTLNVDKTVVYTIIL